MTADRQGRVEIPIRVPPGIRAGVARAVDHNGAARETEVDLQLAPFPRVLVLAPAALDVGSFAEIVVARRRAGRHARGPGRLTLGASAGLAAPARRGRAGRGAFPVRGAAPPRQRRGGADRDGGRRAAQSRPTPRWRCGSARPRSSAISPSTRKLVVGERRRARRSRSRRTTRSATPPPRRASRSPSTAGRRQMAIGAGGIGTLMVEAPAKFDGREKIAVDAALGAIRASEELHVTGGAPARLKIGVRDAAARRRRPPEHRAARAGGRSQRDADRGAGPQLGHAGGQGPTRAHAARRRIHRGVRPGPDSRAAAARAGGDGVAGAARGRHHWTSRRRRCGWSPPRASGCSTTSATRVGPAAFVEAMRPLALRRLPLLLGGTVGYLSTVISGSGPEHRHLGAARDDSSRAGRWRGRAYRSRRASSVRTELGAGDDARAHPHSPR